MQHKYKVGDRVYSGGYKGIITYYFGVNLMEVKWCERFTTNVGSSDVKPIITVKAVLS